MKRLLYLFVFATFMLNSCIENEEILWEGSLVEFDAAAYNARSSFAGETRDYPILTRRPGYSRGVITTATTSFPADPLITRTWAATQNGPVVLRVNLVGAHRPEAQTIRYTVVPDAPTPGAAAVAGTHYGALSGTLTIPANSSFGFIEIPILNPGVSSTTARILVLELQGNETIAPSPRYKRVAISISQQ